MIATGVVLPEGNPNHVLCKSSGAAMRMKSSKLELIAAARPDELPLTRTAMTTSPHAAVIIALACGFLPVTASNGVPAVSIYLALSANLARLSYQLVLTRRP